MASRVSVGFVARAHGVRGLVRVRGSAALGRLSLLFVGDEERPRKIVSREKIGNGVGDEEYLMKLEGVDDRDVAERLKGRALLAERESLPLPVEGEVYVADLVGCTVVGRDGKTIGTVTSTFHSGAHELLVVAQGGEKREALVPLVESIVLEVDLQARRIVCDPPEGLLDL